MFHDYKTDHLGFIFFFLTHLLIYTFQGISFFSFKFFTYQLEVIKNIFFSSF